MQWLSNYDVIDVQAVVDYLCSRPDADPSGVGLMGISKGGSAALYVAGNDPRVKAVVTDGAYTNILLMAYNVKRFVPLFITWDWVRRRTPDFLCNTLPWWARLWLGKRLGCKLMNVESTARRVRQPVFMVHGLSDNMVPLEVARKLRERLGGPSKLWVVPHAKHNTAVFIAAHDYYGRLSRFFARHLSDTQVEEPAWNPVLAVFSRRKAATRAPRRMPVHSTAGTE
jgi:fermentation-respiration switch protein FrsA (DUF1100 family)